MNNTPKLHPAVAALITIVLIGVATGAVVMINQKPDATDSTASTPSVTTTTPSSSTDSSGASTPDAASYKDGQYDATGSYSTPGGTESIKVAVTLSGDTISAVEVTQQADSRESQEYQMAFAGAYKSQVIGKKINDVHLSRVAGSSLTSLGFADALDQIKLDAAA